MRPEQLEGYILEDNKGIDAALKKMDSNGIGMLFIVDAGGKLVGTLTDGDVRRWLIKTGNLNVEITELMSKNPQYLTEACRFKSMDFFHGKRIKAAPILDDEYKIIDIIFNVKLYESLEEKKTGSWGHVPVIIMAGGKGTRLYPYTKILPKPLIPIGDVPIIERIMNRFSQYGINKFWITVNYKKEMIRSYFSESELPYDIEYVEEDEPLGTAGSIGLIKDKLSGPIIVTNCDILVETDYEQLIKHHISSGNDITIVSALKNVTIPYGVLHSSGDGEIDSIEEKPQLSFLVNTGMYVINPEVKDYIPKDIVFHMTDLADKMVKTGKKVGMYPVSEHSFWDMGEFSEMKKMEKMIEERE